MVNLQPDPEGAPCHNGGGGVCNRLVVGFPTGLVRMAFNSWSMVVQLVGPKAIVVGGGGGGVTRLHGLRNPRDPTTLKLVGATQPATGTHHAHALHPPPRARRSPPAGGRAGGQKTAYSRRGKQLFEHKQGFAKG